MRTAATDASKPDYLIFSLGAEEYAVPLQQVQELRACGTITRLAGAAPHLLGVINLRGCIAPIVDLRLCLGLEHGCSGAGNVVVVLQRADALLGVVVDAVAEVVTLAPDQIRPAPSASGGLAERHLLGIGTLAERILILIDLQNLMAEQGLLRALPMAA